MITLPIHLNSKIYSKNMLLFLIQRTSFRIIASILLGLIISGIIASILGIVYIPFHSFIIWILLWFIYICLIPFVIFRRAQLIYHNTSFLHQEMKFIFSTNKISWITSVKTVDFSMDKIQNISTTPKALIISFSPYQVIPIPYKYISQTQWDDILQLLTPYFPKIRSHYYMRFQHKQQEIS